MQPYLPCRPILTLRLHPAVDAGNTHPMRSPRPPSLPVTIAQLVCLFLVSTLFCPSAGERTASFLDKDKRVCIGEPINLAHTGTSTSVLDEHRAIGAPITLVSSPPGTPKDARSLFVENPVSLSPHWEPPKANAPFSQHGKPSKNYKADIRRTSPIHTKEPSQTSRDRLADKSKKLKETASIKKKNRNRILASEQTVNTGEKLLQNIINTGRWDDPLSEWFRRLRIPCHRERVRRVSRALPPSPAAMGIPIAKRPIITLTPDDKSAGPLDPVSEGDSIDTKDETSGPSKSLSSKYASARYGHQYDCSGQYSLHFQFFDSRTNAQASIMGVSYFQTKWEQQLRKCGILI